MWQVTEWWDGGAERVLQCCTLECKITISEIENGWLSTVASHRSRSRGGDEGCRSRRPGPLRPGHRRLCWLSLVRGDARGWFQHSLGRSPDVRSVILGLSRWEVGHHLHLTIAAQPKKIRSTHLNVQTQKLPKESKENDDFESYQTTTP